MSVEQAECKHARQKIYIEETVGEFEKTYTLKCKACEKALYAYSRREVPGQNGDEDIYIGDQAWFDSPRGFDYKKAKKMGVQVVKVKKRQSLADDDGNEEIVVGDDDD
ncbi:uncharacterized protein LOC144357547 [Saccoglossus kowalevskii]